MNFSPLVSIIIPTYNRPESLRRCILSLVSLDADRSQFEVIVVDDGSANNCESIVEKESSDLHLVFLRQENQGPAAARNLGASHAKGRYLAFLDDDCSLPKDWFAIVPRFLDEHTMLGGQTINMLTKNIFSIASQELVDYLYGYFSKNSSEAQFITSNNMIVPASLFMEIGGFSVEFTKAAAEDRDFCDRWLLAGQSTRYSSEIVVEHWHDLTFRQFLQQHFGYGLGASIYHMMRGARRATSIRPEPLRFYKDLVLFPLRKRKNGHALALSLFLFLSQLCNAAGYFWASATRPTR
jgi:glycosyltransferase involved in cell wall biosynthesis